MSLFSRVTPLLAVLVGTACADSNPAGPGRTTPLPALTPAVWHVHSAAGRPLPVRVAERVENGSAVEEYLDSSRVEVNASGGWTRTLWMSRFRAGQYDTRLTNVESGTWVVTDSGYLFRAVPSGRAFVLASAVPGDSVVMPLRSAADGGVIEATLRTIPPEVTIVGTYRVTEVRGRPAPAPIYWEDEYREGDRIMSIHLVVDSASLRLLADSTYRHDIHYTEWEGPVGGGPTTVRHRFVVRDFGSFSREDRLIRFASAWVQNFRFAGTVYNANAMELLHGLTPGDPPVPVRYGRP